MPDAGDRHELNMLGQGNRSPPSSLPVYRNAIDSQRKTKSSKNVCEKAGQSAQRLKIGQVDRANDPYARGIPLHHTLFGSLQMAIRFRALSVLAVT